LQALQLLAGIWCFKKVTIRNDDIPERLHIKLDLPQLLLPPLSAVVKMMLLPPYFS
jgi:hypothetical protein